MPRVKYTYKYVIDELEKEGYVLLTKKSEYKNAQDKIKMLCPNKHIWVSSFKNFNNGNRCRQCFFERYSKSKALSYEFVKSEFEKEGYILLSKTYTNSNNKLQFVCNNGHKYEIAWSCWRQGCRCKYCYTEKQKKLINENNFNWKGGVSKLNLPLYNTYAHQIDWCEKVRRDPENNDLLQVKCTESSCRKWFTPTRNSVCSRIESLNTIIYGENRFYCSNNCKYKCVLYKKKIYPADFVISYDREVQPELRDMVFERDSHECQRCGSKNKLQCHHYESIYFNPIMSADVEMCVTLCTKCHKLSHKDVGCRPIDLTRENLCRGKSHEIRSYR